MLLCPSAKVVYAKRDGEGLALIVANSMAGRCPATEFTFTEKDAKRSRAAEAAMMESPESTGWTTTQRSCPSRDKTEQVSEIVGLTQRL